MYLILRYTIILCKQSYSQNERVNKNMTQNVPLEAPPSPIHRNLLLLFFFLFYYFQKYMWLYLWPKSFQQLFVTIFATIELLSCFIILFQQTKQFWYPLPIIATKLIFISIIFILLKVAKDKKIKNKNGCPNKWETTFGLVF